MKKMYFFILLCLLGSITTTSAQVVDIVTGVNGAYGIARDSSNNLYYTAVSGTVYKVDLTATTPTPVTLASFSPNSAVGLHVNGTDLYICSTYKMHKIDLTAATPTPVDVIDTGSDSYGFINSVVVGNHLYVGSNSKDSIYKVDLTAATPTLTAIASTPGITDVQVHGNDLYYTAINAGKIYKIDPTAASPTPVEVVTGLSNPFGIAFVGDNIYIAGALSTIIKTNLNQSLPITTTTDVYTGLGDPTHITFDGNDMFFTQYVTDKISKFSVFAVSTHEANAAPEWNVFPNPVKQSLNFKNLETTQPYQIINALGQVVQEGTATPSEVVTVRELNAGMYMIRLENGELRQFVKQ